MNTFRLPISWASTNRTRITPVTAIRTFLPTEVCQIAGADCADPGVVVAVTQGTVGAELQETQDIISPVTIDIGYLRAIATGGLLRRRRRSPALHPGGGRHA